MIYLDLDGVFADFWKEADKLNYSENPSKAWEQLDQIPNFFLTLELLPQAKELYDCIPKPNVFLTALPELTRELITAPRDKREWVHKYLNPDVQVVCVASWKDKALFATKGDILIDDSIRNVNAWAQAGGTGIHHTSVYSTIKELRFLGLK